jgi:glycosyltransferase involved in cell wall biosynthesis
MSRIVWFHPRPWGPAQGGGDLRTWGLLAGALSRGHEVLFVVPEGHRGMPPLPGGTLLAFEEPGRIGLAMAKVVSRHPLRSPRLRARQRGRCREEIARFRPDVAVVSEVMAWPIAHAVLPPGVPLIYDCQNIESELFGALRDEATTRFDRVTLTVDAQRVARAERELLARASAVLAVSDLDASVLEARVGPGVVTVVPSSVPDPGATVSPADNPPLVLFVGTLDYSPNTAAVDELIDLVLPCIRRSVPDARLRIVGRRAPVLMRRKAEATEWVELVEDAADLRVHYAGSRCVVLPIRAGGGTKLKVFEALSYGAPLVATPEAIAGIPLRDGVEVLVAQGAEGLADLAAGVLQDDAVAARLGAAGRLAFTDRLSWGSGPVERLDAVLRDLAP